MPASLNVVAAPAPQASAEERAHVVPGRAWYLWPLLGATFLILLLGAVQDVYGNTDSRDVYVSDAVQYLDIARAIARHDWHSALNPLWSQGFPALLAAVRPVFSRSRGRLAHHSLHEFYSLLSDLRGFPLPAIQPPIPSGHVTKPDRRLWLGRAGACLLLFTAVQTCLGQVSRVNPDLHSDWAYIAHLQIVSEIASGPDYDHSWHLPADRQAATLATFRRSGATAVFVNGKPPALGGPEW